MNKLQRIKKYLEDNGFGHEIKDGSIVVYESWDEACLQNYGVKTYKEALKKLNKNLEKELKIKLVQSKVYGGISTSIFRI